jgi:hypothetical protein
VCCLVINLPLDDLLVNAVAVLRWLSNEQFLDLLVELSGALVDNRSSYLHYDELQQVSDARQNQ